MLLRLARQAYIRQYGDFSYVFGKVNSFDQMFKDADVFLRAITRTPKDEEKILQEIFSSLDFATSPSKEQIKEDFYDFIFPLIQEKIILKAQTPQELDAQELYFSYADPDPKTLRNTKALSKKEYDFLPQNILSMYFDEHPTLFSLHIDITQNCTERCVHCYIPEYDLKCLPLDKICEILSDFRKMGGFSIALSGGECMMHPHFKEIIRYARQQDIIVSVLSNLTLCTDDIISVLQETDSTVQVSLYSMNPEIHDKITQRHGSWSITKKAIEKLYAANVPVRISCPTMKSNYAGYLEVLKYAQSLKMHAQTDFVIMAKSNHDCSNLCHRLDLQETRAILEDIIFRSVPMESEYFSPGKKMEMPSPEQWGKQKICGAGIDSLCLNADGFYYPCAGFSGYPVGNCFENKLQDVWEKSEALIKIRNIRGYDFPQCMYCKDRDYCTQCMCRNYNETGDMFKPASHFCDVAAINHEVVDERLKMIKKMSNDM